MSDINAPHPLPAIATKSAAAPASVPSVAVFGCGGFGINIARSMKEQILELATLRYIDTARSNVTDDEDVLLLGTPGQVGDGSGKLRAEHATAIHKKLSAMTPAELGIADVNILLFGLSGGSGSVVGPILMDRIAETGNRVICIGVADVSSQIDVTNTERTLQSMQNVVEEGEYYVQAMLFDNDAGRSKVNRIVRRRLMQLLTIEAVAAAELDRNDRRNWLNAQRMVGAAPGIRLLHVVGGVEPDDDPTSGEIWTYEPDHVYDSVISIGVLPAEQLEETDPIFVDLKLEPRVRFEGTFRSIKLTPMLGMVAGDANGAAVLISKLTARTARFAAQDASGSALISTSKSGKKGPGGVIL